METEDLNIIKCPKCGKTIEKDAERCKHCGSWFGKPAVEVEKEVKGELIE